MFFNNTSYIYLFIYLTQLTRNHHTASETKTRITLTFRQRRTPHYLTLKSAGDFREISLPSDDVLTIVSQHPVSVGQLCKSFDADRGRLSDPFLAVVPSIGSGSNYYRFRTPEPTRFPLRYANVVAETSFLDDLYLNDARVTTNWIRVDRAFSAARIPLLGDSGDYVLRHNLGRYFTVLVYGFGVQESYGFNLGSVRKFYQRAMKKTTIPTPPTTTTQKTTVKTTTTTTTTTTITPTTITTNIPNTTKTTKPTIIVLKTTPTTTTLPKTNKHIPSNTKTSIPISITTKYIVPITTSKTTTTAHTTIINTIFKTRTNFRKSTYIKPTTKMFTTKINIPVATSTQLRSTTIEPITKQTNLTNYNTHTTINKTQTTNKHSNYITNTKLSSAIPQFTDSTTNPDKVSPSIISRHVNATHATSRFASRPQSTSTRRFHTVPYSHVTTTTTTQKPDVISNTNTESDVDVNSSANPVSISASSESVSNIVNVITTAILPTRHHSQDTTNTFIKPYEESTSKTNAMHSAITETTHPPVTHTTDSDTAATALHLTGSDDNSGSDTDIVSGTSQYTRVQPTASPPPSGQITQVYYDVTLLSNVIENYMSPTPSTGYQSEQTLRPDSKEDDENTEMLGNIGTTDNIINITDNVKDIFNNDEFTKSKINVSSTIDSTYTDIFNINKTDNIINNTISAIIKTKPPDITKNKDINHNNLTTPIYNASTVTTSITYMINKDNNNSKKTHLISLSTVKVINATKSSIVPSTSKYTHSTTLPNVNNETNIGTRLKYATKITNTPKENLNTRKVNDKKTTTFNRILIDRSTSTLIVKTVTSKQHNNTISNPARNNTTHSVAKGDTSTQTMTTPQIMGMPRDQHNVTTNMTSPPNTTTTSSDIPVEDRTHDINETMIILDTSVHVNTYPTVALPTAYNSTTTDRELSTADSVTSVRSDNNINSESIMITLEGHNLSTAITDSELVRFETLRDNKITQNYGNQSESSVTTNRKNTPTTVINLDDDITITNDITEVDVTTDRYYNEQTYARNSEVVTAQPTQITESISDQYETVDISTADTPTKTLITLTTISPMVTKTADGGSVNVFRTGNLTSKRRSKPSKSTNTGGNRTMKALAIPLGLLLGVPLVVVLMYAAHARLTRHDRPDSRIRPWSGESGASTNGSSSSGAASFCSSEYVDPMLLEARGLVTPRRFGGDCVYESDVGRCRSLYICRSARVSPYAPPPPPPPRVNLDDSSTIRASCSSFDQLQTIRKYIV